MEWTGCTVLLVTVLLMLPDGRCQSEPDIVCQKGCFCKPFYTTCFPHAALGNVPDFPTATRRIYIAGANLSKITDEDFKNYTDLRELILQGNKITSISGSAFANNQKLVTLDLGNNAITELDPQTFNGLHNLRTLKLSSNYLNTLEDEMFYGLDHLTTLSVANNELSRIPFSVMQSLDRLSTLDVSGNQFECDCEIAWMKAFSPLSDIPILCGSPPSLLGQDIATLTYDQLGCVAPYAQAVNDTVRGFSGDQYLELRCDIGGDPEPEMEWYLEGEALVASSDFSLPDNGSLLVVYMGPELAGEYVCTATNLVSSASATIELQYAGLRPPVIFTKPSDTHLFIDSTLSLVCVTDQHTETYQWFKDGKLLSPNSDVTILDRQGLMVTNAQRNDSGVYMCVATNSAGSNNASAVVDVTSTILTCDGTFSPNMIEGLREKVNLAFNRTQQELRRSSTSPGSLLRRLKFPESGIIEHLKAAEIFDQAVNMLRRQLNNGSVPAGTKIPDLSECELEVLSVLSGCTEHQRVADCSDCSHRYYRSSDGSCNNLDNPTQGAAEVPFLRLLDPAYEDGVGQPVGWEGSTKPSARLISRNLLSTKEVTGDDKLTLMLMQFGQFVDHDLDFAPGSPSDIVFDIADTTMLSSCNDICYNDAPCFPIPVPNSDPRINRECLPFTRSSAVCGTGTSSLLVGKKSIRREQLNAITSYLDGSMIYGSTERIARKLREPGESGKLLEGNPTVFGTKFLPFDNESLIECSTGIHANRSKCFLGGDVRTNEQVGLTSMHTLFYREHNRVVAILTRLNPHWDGEKLYQEARRIVVAEWQHIVYNEYLPRILGSSFLKEYSGYNSSVDATIANAFATAAFRFGHSQIMPLFQRLDEDYEPLDIGPLRLQDAFFAPFRILNEGSIDPLIRGLIASPLKMRLSHQAMNNNLTEALFAQAHEIALDLAALNIQRGRDHGLPSYAKWRSYCGLGLPTTVEDLSDHITNSSIRDTLRDVYGDDPDNIDLWVGGLLEDVLPGTQLGPTFLCIIGDQFRRLQAGDRFYYERSGQFSPDQLVQLKQASLSRIICDNADNIDRIPADAFLLQNSSEFVSCGGLPRVDLIMWKDCGECTESGSPRGRRSTLFKVHTDSDNHQIMEHQSCILNGAVLASGESLYLTECIECSCLDGGMTCTMNIDCEK